MKKYALSLLAFIVFSGSRAQDFSAFSKQIFVSGRDTLNYRILYPENYKPTGKYPLIIFLHGSGERGTDNQKQLTRGGPFFLKDSIRKINPAIVIFPQCPPDNTWSFFSFFYDSVKHEPNLIFTFQVKPTTPARLVKMLADSLVSFQKVDTAQMYIGGLSLGGFGTWDFIERYPGYFKKAFPICGGGDTTYASKIAGRTAVWMFHGSADPVVSVKYSKQYFSALKAVGADVKFREYEGVGHNSWNNAFSEPGLMEWIVERKTATGKMKN